MKVLQLGPYPPPHGGVQTNLVAIRQFLRRRNIPCAIINLTRHRQTDADDVFYPKGAWQLLRMLLRLEYDIIHLHVGGHLTPRLIGLGLICCLMQARSVLTFHSGGYPSSAAGRSARRLSIRGFVFRRFDSIVGVNQEIIDMFRRFGVQAERLHLILPHAFPSGDSNAKLPEEITAFMTQHSPLLLTVGLLESEYGLPLQIKVLGLILEHFNEAGLLIIGSGSLEAELRQLIASKPYAGHVLLAGDVPHDATMKAIATSDLFLRTTLYDGDSIAVREALHLGTPVIATDNAMRPAGVKLIPPADVGLLYQAIEDCLQHKTERNQIRSGNE
jgi:glycosyltransferase involved in cell wall biosynthesis